MTVVPNGVDLEFYRPGVVPPAGRGWAARAGLHRQDGLSPERRRRAVVRRRGVAADPGAECPTRASTSSASSRTRGWRRWPSQPGITLTGRVPDTRPYIAGAGVYVVPLRIGGGTRLKVLEAMAMGQAIVSTRLGCDGFDFTDGREVLFRRRARGLRRGGASNCCTIARRQRHWGGGARVRGDALRLGCHRAAAGGVVP